MFSDNSHPKPRSSRVVAQSHFKRLGRELAMQYLYLRDMAQEENAEAEAAARQMFWDQAEAADLADDERIFKKAHAYADKLIDGVIFYMKEIDGILETFSEKWDISRMAAVDRNIIRIAVFELKHCPDIPALVSIDEAIEIAKSFATEKSGTFINGILNGVKDSLPSGTKQPQGEKGGF